MLSTSMKVNSAIDDPVNYYTATSLQNRYHDLSELLDNMTQSVQALKGTSSTLSSIDKTVKKISILTQSALSDIPLESWINPDPPLTDEVLMAMDGVCGVARTSEKLLEIIESGVKGKIIITDHLEFTDTILNLKEGQELVGIGTYAADNTNAIESDGRKASLTFNFTDGTTAASTTGIVMAGKNAVSDMAIKVNLADKKGVTAAINASAGGDNRVGNVEITINDTDVTGNVSGYGVYVGKNSDITMYGKGSVVYTAEEPSTKAYNFVVADTAELNFEKDSSWIVVSPLTNATGIDIAVGAKVNVDDARLIINNLGTSGKGINASGDLNINGESKIEIDTGNVGISGTRNINVGGASVVDIASSGVAFSLGATANLNISDNADIDIKTNNIGISNGNVTVSGKATLDVDAIGRGMEGGSFESRDDAQVKIDTKVEGFYNTNILTGGNSTVEVLANSYGVYLDGKTANFADNSKITINSTSHAFYATNSGEISFGGNVTADITTKNANADVFKLLNGAVLNFNDKANVKASAKGNAADIIDLTANSVVNFGSNSKLVGTGAYYENALVSILNDSTDSAINFAKGAQVGFYNEVQDINRLWMVNENLSFVDTGKTYNLSVEHLTDFTIVADAVNEVDDSKPTPTTTITKEWLESQADVGVVVTNIDELKAAIASNTQKLIVVYGQIDINNDKIALKSGQKLVGVSYFADRNAAAADVDGNRFSKLNFNYSYNAQHADNAITLSNDTLLSGLEINYSHNYASSNSSAIYMNKASGVEISDIDLNVTDSRTDASINLNGIYASGSEYSLAGDVNIKLNNDGLSSTGLRGIYNYSSTSAYYGGDLNLNIDAKNNTAIYNYVYVNMEVNDDAKITTTGNINSTHGCKLIFSGNSEVTTLGYSGISNSSHQSYPGTTTEVSGNAKITTGRLSIGGTNNDVRAQLDIKDNAQIYITSEYQDGDSFS
ncbi:MAG: hypothetical protein IKA03_05060, partial [Alphaproteobacteria bacterium]|nr:hypothetical protein [Alphaproteobacteria bacterium]